MTLNTTSPSYTGYKIVYRGEAITLERSGKVDYRMFYIWAKDEQAALKAAQRVFPKAQRVVIRKRAG